MKIRIIITTSLTATDVKNAIAWFVLLGATALFWYGVIKLLA